MSTPRGTTPTFTFTFSSDVNLSIASNVYVTFKSQNGTVLLTKSGEELTISDNIVSVSLTQKETLSFYDTVKIQVNWTYPNGKRASSEIETFNFSEQLLNKEVE